MRDRRPLLLLVLALPAWLLAGCPGGDGPEPPPPPVQEPPPTNRPPSVSEPDGGAPTPSDAAAMPDGPPAPAQPFECKSEETVLLTADSTITVGKTAGAAIIGCRGPITNVTWTQTDGPRVELLSGNTQAISFDVPEVGTYTFQVSYGLSTGINGVGTVSVRAAAPSTPSRVTVRADQAVRSQGNTSVRAWPTLAVGEVMAGISWEQTRGPTVMLDMADPRRIVFKAPDVAGDTILGFRAIVRTTGGATDVDDVMVVVEKATPVPMNGTFSRTHVSRVYPYKRNSKYANVLVSCVFRPDLTSATGCALSTLPLLAQATPGRSDPHRRPGDGEGAGLPRLDGCQLRAVPDHPGPGRRLRRMLGAVTAVVIGAHVRPLALLRGHRRHLPGRHLPVAAARRARFDRRGARLPGRLRRRPRPSRACPAGPSTTTMPGPATAGTPAPPAPSTPSPTSSGACCFTS